MFGENSFLDQKLTTFAICSYRIGPSRYMLFDTTYHITRDLEKLAIRNNYQGGDQIHTTNGLGMNISYTKHTSLTTSSHSFILKDVLHIPKSKKNLVSIHRLTSNNSTFIKLYPTLFLVKDKKSKQLCLEEDDKGSLQLLIRGLYPLTILIIKEVHIARRPSVSTWNNHLGHLSFSIIEQVVSNINLLCSQESL